MNQYLFIATVMHGRLSQKQHFFSYKVVYLFLNFTLIKTNLTYQTEHISTAHFIVAFADKFIAIFISLKAANK
jgi:DUF1365 family protein